MEPQQKKIRIALVVPNLNRGGAEKVLLYFVNNIDYDLYQPFIFTLKKEGDLLGSVNPEVQIVDLNKPRVYFSLFKIKQQVRVHKIDVLIGWMGHINALLAFFKPIFPGKMVLLCRESSIPSKFIMHYTAPGLFKFMYRYLNRYDGIICQSQAMKEDLIENFRVKPAKINVIHNPVVPSRKNTQINAVAQSFIKDSKMLLFVGRFSAEKQVGLLIEAMQSIRNDYKLILVGYGPLEKEVRQKITDAGLTNQILIVNDCDDPTPYYNRANCLVLMSSFEGFPNVLLEANLQGCPVIVYKTKGGAKEIVTPKSGVYIDPQAEGGTKLLSDTITDVCEHPERFNREEIAVMTRERFDVKQTMNVYQQYIQQIFQKKQS